MSTSKHCYRILILAVVILLVNGAAYAGGYNLAGVGAKGLAMSGAFRAIADDWSAMYWNPAGLAGQQNSVTLSGKMLYPIVWLTPNVTSNYPGYEGYVNGVKQSTKETGYLAGGFGVTYGINDKFTAGFSAFSPSALGADWRNLFTGPPYGYNNNVPYPEKGWNSKIAVIDFHPTLAYQATDKLKLGIGIAIQYGDILLESPKLVASGAPMPFHQFYVDAVLEGDGLGYGFNLGALYDLTEKISLGLSYRGSVAIAVEGKVKQTLILPTSLGIQAANPSQAALFGGGSLVAEPTGKADFPIPADAGLGISMKATDQLTLAFDVIWTNWGSVDEIEVEMDGVGPTGSPAENSTLIMNYEDTYRFNIGFEYLVSEFNDFRIRGGYYYDPSPIPDGSLRPTITDIEDKSNISLGFRWMPAPKVALEGYWEHLFTGERTIAEIDEDGDGAIDNVAGDWKLQVDTFGISLSYYFGGYEK